jgi:hypothetical protein
MDLIAVEHGVASAPRGSFLVAVFPGIQTAVLTARRLQWALLGLSEADRFAGTAATVLVHSTPDLPALENDGSVLLPLEKAAPGRILLTPKAAELLRDLPGLPLQAASDAGLCELLWRASEKASSRSSDEEALSRFIQLNGLEAEAPAPLQQLAVPPAEQLPAVAPVEPQPARTDRGSITLPDATEPDAIEPNAMKPEATVQDATLPDAVKSVRSVLEDEASGPRRKPRWLLITASAAAILLVLAAAVAVAYKYKWEPKPAAVAMPAASSAPAPQPTPVASVPQPGPGSSVVPPAQSLPANPVPPAVSPAIATEPAKPSEPAPKSRKHQESVQANPTAGDSVRPQARQPKAAAAGNCDLDTKLLPKMLDQAERNREQGNYPAALRQFRAVLACDRNNARARRGLDLTGLAMQHQ